ncbi:tRNA (cytidine(34)-2'-O)-methyltransferase [Spiroplasma endosymbiont of Anurida maritima]
MKKINIVLYEPEIAQNVGAIIRTSKAVNAKLHIIEPTGFIFDSRFLKRASVNYVDQSDIVLYDDWSQFINKNNNPVLFCSTRYGVKKHTDFNYKKQIDSEKEIYILFGKESTGIPKDIIINNKETSFRIPMHKDVRSLNVAVSVSIVAYEVVRQLDFENLELFEYQKGKNFIL